MPEINKSTRHSKITGDFAESLVLYWLSKHGFESAKVDHIGIGLIAKNPVTDELMGISVKLYKQDKEIISFTFSYQTSNWWQQLSA